MYKMVRNWQTQGGAFSSFSSKERCIIVVEGAERYFFLGLEHYFEVIFFDVSKWA
jgi:hypothetical protein